MFDTPVPIIALVCLAVGAPSQQPAEDPAAHARTLMAQLAAGLFAQVEAQFTDRMKAALPPGALEAAWVRLTAQAGAFRRCAPPRVQAAGNLRVAVASCEFDRTHVDVQMSFDAAGRLAGLLYRPPVVTVPYVAPPYADPSTYSEREVTVGSRDWPLPATLDVPVGGGPFPALVLVHGSGPNDRDETLGPNKPFKDLALGLASRGIAVLRYEKRSRMYPARPAHRGNLTVADETIDDAVEAVRALRAEARIDPARVFVLGHSLGGMLIPRIGARDPGIAGLVVLAGAARPLEQAIVDQTRYLVAAAGAITPEGQRQIDETQKSADAVHALTPSDAQSSRLILGAPPSYWLDLRGYDPPAAARALSQPLLILQGERDYQVTMEEFGRWKAALAGRTHVTFESYPALNHLFIEGSGKSLPAEYQVAGHVAEAVVRDIATWIGRQRPASSP